MMENGFRDYVKPKVPRNLDTLNARGWDNHFVHGRGSNEARHDGVMERIAECPAHEGFALYLMVDWDHDGLRSLGAEDLVAFKAAAVERGVCLLVDWWLYTVTWPPWPKADVVFTDDRVLPHGNYTRTLWELFGPNGGCLAMMRTKDACDDMICIDYPKGRVLSARRATREYLAELTGKSYHGVFD